MSEGQSLDELLGSEAPQEVQEEAEQPQIDRPRDEHGRFLPKQTGEEEPAPQPEPESVTPTPEAEPERIPIAALKDERSKRQQLEQRLQEYEQYFAQLQAQPQQQQPQEEPDMFADPEGFKAHLAAQIRADLLREVQPTIQQSQLMGRAEVSEMLARQKYEDYDAIVDGHFKEALSANPFLLNQLQQAPDPATFAYNAGKQWAAAKSYGSEAAPSKEDLKAQLREEIMTELGLNRPQVPTTMAGDRSVGARTGPGWTGPKSLGDILG